MVNTRRIFCSNNTWVDHYIQIHEYLYLEAGLWYVYRKHWPIFDIFTFYRSLRLHVHTKPVSKEEYKFCTVWVSGRGLWRAGFALQLSCNRKRVFWNLHIYVYYYFSTNQMVLQFIEYFTNFFINCDQNVECDWPAGNRLITASLKTCYLYSKLFSFFFVFPFLFLFLFALLYIYQ